MKCHILFMFFFISFFVLSLNHNSINVVPVDMNLVSIMVLQWCQLLKCYYCCNVGISSVRENQNTVGSYVITYASLQHECCPMRRYPYIHVCNTFQQPAGTHQCSSTRIVVQGTGIVDITKEAFPSEKQ